MERTTDQVITSDRIHISFDLYQEPGRDAALILCPGFCQSKETKIFRELASALASKWDVICMDFRGHGRSDGQYTFSTHEGRDLDAILHWAEKAYTRIGVLGFSMGAAIAINHISHRGGIQSLIGVSSPSAFEEIEFKFWTPEAIRTGIQSLEAGAGCRPGSAFLEKERPADNIGKISPVPVCLIHGTNDPIVSHQHSERLYQAAGEPKRLSLIEGGGHAEALYRRYPEQFLRLTGEWFDATLLR